MFSKKLTRQFCLKLKHERRALVLLHGEMGAGKTTFVSEVVRRLVKKVHPSSPTFNIVNQYADNIFHADLYRIKDEAELANIGFAEILEGENIVFIEWPEKAPILIGGLESDVIHVSIKVVNGNERKVFIN